MELEFSEKEILIIIDALQHYRIELIAEAQKSQKEESESCCTGWKMSDLYFSQCENVKAIIKKIEKRIKP